MSGLNACDSWRKSAPSLAEKNGYILQHEQFSDVSFHVGESAETSEIVKAHKVLLMTASQVFERMFTGNFKEASQNSECPIEVADIDPSSFKTMLKYIYTREIPKNLTTVETIGVVNAARKYDIGELETVCWKHLRKQLGVVDCVTIFQAAQLYGNKTVEDNALKFIKGNFGAVLESEDFANLLLHNLGKLVSANDAFVSSELQIFNGVLRWSTAKCVEQNLTVTSANQRLVLGDVIYLINFSAIPAVDFALTVVPSGLLTFQECILLFQHSVVPLELKMELPKLPFINISRQQSPCIVKFVDVFEQSDRPLYSGAIQQFVFQVDKPIKILGFGFKGHHDPSFKFIVTVGFGDSSANSCPVTIVRKKAMFSSNSLLTVDLDVPLEVAPLDVYGVAFRIKGPRIMFRNLRSRRNIVVFTENGVNFTTEPNRTLALSQIKFKMT